MRVWFSFLIISCFISCDAFLNSKKEKQIPEKNVIDFSKVDVSPTFYNCKNASVLQKRTCFRNRISKIITNVLTSKDLNLSNSINEKIEVELLINKSGKVSINNIYSSDSIIENLPVLDSLIRVSVNKIPKLVPAYKNNLAVTTQYTLPIVLKTIEE